ncbi:hypothetical protein H0H81_011554 [Sphagnurus paluster]|uniref:Uncharacterized protein n=1 Tax=Sphagnurus paluster TaxID=117069 RepID=A0A9P7GJ18_9AGAR|nr:hypothetical protein H0H81_011554 [Sphagnurus paluster]
MYKLLLVAQALRGTKLPTLTDIPPAFEALLSDPNVFKNPLHSKFRLKIYFTKTYVGDSKSVDAINNWLLANGQLIGKDMEKLFAKAKEEGGDALSDLKKTTFIMITPEGAFNGVKFEGITTHNISKLKLFGAPVYTFVNTIAYRMNEAGDHVVDSEQRKQIDNTNFLSNGVVGYELLKEQMSSIDGLNAEEQFTAKYLPAPNIDMGQFMARIDSPFGTRQLENPNPLVVVCDTQIWRGGAYKLAPVEDGILKRAAVILTQFFFGMQAKANEEEKPEQIAYKMKDIAKRQILKNTETNLVVRVSDFLYLPIEAGNFKDEDVQRMNHSSLLPDLSKK